MEGRPQLPGRLENPRETERVIRALEYQLAERISLVSPPDVYVGDLLLDLGNIMALTNSIERSVAVLQLSEKYGTSRPDVLRIRLDHLRSLLPDRGLSLKPTPNDTPGQNTEQANSETPKSDTKPGKITNSWPDAATPPLILAPIALTFCLLLWQRRRRIKVRD